MAPIDERKIYSGRGRSVLLVMIGALAIGCGTALWFVAADRLLALVLMGLPAGFLGVIALLAGISGLKARIEIHHGALTLAAPQWRGCPLPPVRKHQFSWDEIRALRHRTEVYHLLPGRGLPFPVDVYAIDTACSRVIVGGKSIPQMAQAIRDIALRSGRAILEDSPVQAGILGSLINGPPAWF
jgi:hypothetical protein